VSGVPDRASIHRGWARDAGQHLGEVRTEATFGARGWDVFLAYVSQIPLGDVTADALILNYDLFNFSAFFILENKS
jgi:hypothetical protein